MTTFLWSPPSQEEIAAWGGIKTAADFPEPHTDVWHENWEVLQLYSRNCDQWRVGPSGPYALDLNVIYRDLDDHGITGEDRVAMLTQLRKVVRRAKEMMK